MKYLYYCIGLKKVIAKIRKEAAFRQYTLEDVILVSSSILLAALASIKLLPMRTIAYHMFGSTLLPFGTGGFRTLAVFKMELFETKVNGWKLLLILHRVPSYMWQGS